MNPPNKSTTVFPQTEEIPVPLEIHPSVSPLAAELLMKVAERLALNPACYNQQWPRHSCNSPCCIIGHMEHLSGVDGNGLTEHQRQSLFYVSHWPEGLQPEERTIMAVESIPASDGIARIEHMLKTGQ